MQLSQIPHFMKCHLHQFKEIFVQSLFFANFVPQLYFSPKKFNFSHTQIQDFFIYLRQFKFQVIKKAPESAFARRFLLSNPYCQQRLTFKTKANGSQPQ